MGCRNEAARQEIRFDALHTRGMPLKPLGVVKGAYYQIRVYLHDLVGKFIRQRVLKMEYGV